MESNKNKVVFNKDMRIGDIMDLHPYIRNVLMGFGMFCFGCPISQFETLEEACLTHGIELDFFLEKLNEVNEMDDEVAGADYGYDDFEF